MHDACTINPYFHVDFCKRDVRTILPASAGIAQTHPNYDGSCYHYDVIPGCGWYTHITSL